jgi:hypothetical protein
MLSNFDTAAITLGLRVECDNESHLSLITCLCARARSVASFSSSRNHPLSKKPTQARRVDQSANKLISSVASDRFSEILKSLKVMACCWRGGGRDNDSSWSYSPPTTSNIDLTDSTGVESNIDVCTLV